jgi:hypothetical protein
MLGTRGWRFMGDEFALVELEGGQLRAFPRAISLKNASIAELARHVAADRFGPVMRDTPKGTIQHLRPEPDAVDRMDEPARPA